MWELIFMLLILKIPIAYLCWVVWWAIRAEPLPPEPAVNPASLPDGPEPPPGRRPFGHRFPRRPRSPHGAPTRSYPRVAVRVTVVRSEGREPR